ncbi:MAG: hypothetical protein K2W96_00895 [Gemmataceae bacterium]|nr:hypothetical protein [Gemmataceae bacterium]
MRARNLRWACWLAVVLALAPSASQAQEFSYAPPPFNVHLPTGSTRPESGLYFNTAFALYMESNPLKNQPIAVRGFKIFDDSLGVPPGTFIGSRTEALNVQQLRDDRRWEPGFTFNVGYKFNDGSAMELNWLFLSNQTLTRGVTPIQRDDKPIRPDQADTFLFTDVFNLPLDYSGPPNKVTGASQFGVFGLFNGATYMIQSWRQRFQQWELSFRSIVHDTEDSRITALVGPRYAWLWQKYQLRSVNLTADGQGGGGPGDIGLYSAITSNRMYGVHAGLRCEGYWGRGFGWLAEGQGALFLDSVKERGKFETADKYGGFPESKFARREWSIVPALDGSLGVNWFPADTIQVQLKYQGMIFFNTQQTQRPFARDYLMPRPNWQSTIFWAHGLQAAIGLHF